MNAKAFGTGLIALLASTAAPAVTPLAPLTLTTRDYTQNFDSLASTGTSSALPQGWQLAELGSGTAGSDDAYVAGNGSSNTGTAYSFGATGGSERALGSLTSGTATPLRYGAIITNGLGAAITSLGISYYGEQWRLANGTGDVLTFEYSTDATSVVDGNWTRLSALDFNAIFSNGSSTGAALDGNATANRQLITGTIAGLNVANGTRFGLRWSDVDVTGSDQGLAIDDLVLRATTAVTAVPEPQGWAMLLVGFGALGTVVRRRSSRAGAVVFA